MKPILIYNAQIINEGIVKTGSIIIKGPFINDIIYESLSENFLNNYELIDASNLYLIPGVIDDQVHFREPGLTHKGDIHSESKAAVAGGITSYMEMPNTQPQTTSIELLEMKYNIAAKQSLSNYSFYLGATNENIKEIEKLDPSSVCGLKVFMGASTGNMLVDKMESLNMIFKKSPVLITTHCEDENTIQNNLTHYKNHYGENIPVHYHPEIRSAEACYLSTNLAVNLAKKHEARLHVLHVSTQRELELFFDWPLDVNKKITSEVCIHHLWFEQNDYYEKGNLIKWNPAIKSIKDRDALRKAINGNLIDIIATDHAPHTFEEKNNPYLKAPSGGPMVQHSLNAMMELAINNIISLSDIVKKMCHNPAILYNIDRRGFIRKGYYADLVLVDPNNKWTVEKENLLYKCNWSPFEGQTFHTKILKTFVNGKIAYKNGIVDESVKGMRLLFNR